ncbi:MAG: cell envelope integrity protein TolA [Ramlibacter sp.]|nr:cell envelope integrity protein TolA [Ramlibacter sp.]
MQDSADRLDFAPPPQPAAARAFVLAILAHLLLMLALTWGINWNRESENVAAEAELWSSAPQQAAPNVVQAPPLPTPTPAPPPPPPPPVAKVAPPPAPPVAIGPDIALEREKKRRELAADRRQEELEQRKKLDARKKQEELKHQQLAAAATQQKAAAEEEERKKKKAEELVKAKAKARQDESRLEAQRKENLEKMMRSAAGTGPKDSAGAAARSSGPSASYAGRIAARIKPNIVFSDIVSGNPAAVVQIRVAPDGTIVGRKLQEPSGVKSWDDAVLRAIDRTETLPRDTDGRVVPEFLIRFRPND